MEKLSDTYLISRIADGEISCFAIIVDRYKNFLLTLIVRIVDNKEDAKDILQEVFISVYKNLDKFHQESSFSTWIYRIAYNASINFLRKNNISFIDIDQIELENSQDSFIDNNESLKKENLYIALDNAIKKLAPSEKALVILFYRQEKSIAQCGEILSMSESNIKVKLHRIRKKLSVLMNQEI
ncbi:MAG: sigma-70 family RNA polymerase sigma factor [Bacteroidales bacterium]|nr:sigma-70 family RNA polymerase sigma factor [Bacteroidales bacterium]